MGRRLEIMAATVLTVVAIWAGPARAQEAAPAAARTGAAGLRIELNKLSPAQPSGCRLTFVVTNASGARMPAPRFEFVLFDTDGLVERLTTFDFGALAEGKTSVRQFDLQDLACDRLGKLLVNGPAQCGGAVAPHCSARLELASRAQVTLSQ